MRCELTAKKLSCSCAHPHAPTQIPSLTLPARTPAAAPQQCTFSRHLRCRRCHCPAHPLTSPSSAPASSRPCARGGR
eukprot:782147-Prymnesium_polylepis.2